MTVMMMRVHVMTLALHHQLIMVAVMVLLQVQEITFSQWKQGLDNLIQKGKTWFSGLFG